MRELSIKNSTNLPKNLDVSVLKENNNFYDKKAGRFESTLSQLPMTIDLSYLGTKLLPK